MDSDSGVGELLLEARGLVKSYAGKRVVDGAHLTLYAGECLWLRGPNGSGKTTLLGMLSGRIRPDAGSASIGGVPIRGAGSGAGVVGHEPMLHPGLTVRENIEFFCAILGSTQAQRETSSLLTELGLNQQADTELRLLSRGQQQRAGLARALAGDPPVLLLDEPFTGLDDPSRDLLIGSLRRLLERGKGMILTSHETDVAQAISTGQRRIESGQVVTV